MTSLNALNSSEDSILKDILLISNDWIWEIDTKGIFTFTSGQIKEILGYEVKGIIGKYVYDLFLPEERSRLKKEIEKIISTEKPIINRVNWNLTKDGRKVCLLTNGIPIYNEAGILIGYRGVDRDITSEKLAEKKLQHEIKEKQRIEKDLVATKKEAEEIARTRSEFIAKLTREIRTPLNGILGTSTLLKESPMNQEQYEFIEIIELSANNLLSIVNDVVDITEIETGHIALDQNNFNIIEVLNEIERKHAHKSREKNLKFFVEIKPGVPKFLKGDVFRLKQIFLHLLNNALKFTKKGSITLSVEKHSENHKGSKLLFKVIDTGIGMTKRHREGIFEELRQGKSALTKTYGGSGLGLVICRKLVHLLGGEIGVESEPGKGSVFWFTVVFGQGISPQPKPMQKVSDESEKDDDRLTILVAEDNFINQKVLMASLKQLGHDVEIAVNGKMAVEMFKKNKYDLILMDIQMPVMDGITATKEIRKLEKEKHIKSKVKIVAITANVSKEDRDHCLKIGMDDYIIKPFKSEDLDSALII